MFKGGGENVFCSEADKQSKTQSPGSRINVLSFWGPGKYNSTDMPHRLPAHGLLYDRTTRNWHALKQTELGGGAVWSRTWQVNQEVLCKPLVFVFKEIANETQLLDFKCISRRMRLRNGGRHGGCHTEIGMVRHPWEYSRILDDNPLPPTAL